MSDASGEGSELWREWETRADAYHRYVYWYFQSVGLFLSAAVLAGAYAFLRGGSTEHTATVGVLLLGLWFVLVVSHPFVHRYAVEVGNRVRELEEELGIPEGRRTGPILEAVTLGGAAVWTLLGVAAVLTASDGRPCGIGLALVMAATPVVSYWVAHAFWPFVHYFGFVGIEHFGQREAPSRPAPRGASGGEGEEEQGG